MPPNKIGAATGRPPEECQSAYHEKIRIVHRDCASQGTAIARLTYIVEIPLFAKKDEPWRDTITLMIRLMTNFIMMIRGNRFHPHKLSSITNRVIPFTITSVVNGITHRSHV